MKRIFKSTFGSFATTRELEEVTDIAWIPVEFTYVNQKEIAWITPGGSPGELFIFILASGPTSSSSEETATDVTSLLI